MSASSPTSAPIFFDATLYPNRSLSRNGFRVLMTAIVALSALIGALFFAAGAWPVTGMFVLDVLLVYLAFRWNYRQGRLTELIRLRADALSVRRIHPNGRIEDWRFDPFWVRIGFDDRATHDSQLTLSSHGRSLAVGAFLAPHERQSLAAELRAAVRDLRDRPFTRPV